MHYSCWNVDVSDYPAKGTFEDRAKFLLRYAILAPSAHNTQPWAYKISEGIIDVFRDVEHTLNDGDPTLRETWLGVGAFIENLSIAAQYFGMKAEVELKATLNTDLHIARVKLNDNSQGHHYKDLFPGILRRHTNRGMYKKNLSPSFNPMKVAEYAVTGTLVSVIDRPDVKERVAKMVETGTRIALSMPSMKKELAALVHNAAEKKSTGMTLESMFSTPPGAEPMKAERFLDAFDVEMYASETYKKWISSPLVIAISTELDGPSAWIESGRIMERIVLYGALCGLTHDIAAAPVEIPTISPLLRHEIGTEMRPQMLFRLGIPEDEALTIESSRRPVI